MNSNTKRDPYAMGAPEPNTNYQPNMPGLKHSGLGIASFIISISSLIFIIFVFVLAGMIAMSNPSGIPDDSPILMLIGFLVIIGLMAAMIGIGLGIGGICTKTRKRLFAILGTVINGVIFLTVIFLFIVGSSM
ncbi:hypothetical protein JW979_15935 [bacterium]|nr:hypothetical protein [candidate division CSSED10-310 bacterium]